MQRNPQIGTQIRRYMTPLEGLKMGFSIVTDAFSLICSSTKDKVTNRANRSESNYVLDLPVEILHNLSLRFSVQSGK